MTLRSEARSFVRSLVRSGAVVAAALLAAAAPAHAQISSFGAFDTIHADTINLNDRSGEFSIPGRFTGTRQGTEISGNSAHGNVISKQVAVEGNVVVHLTRSLSVVGEAASSAQGPSTLTCDHLDIDGATQVYHAVGNVHYVSGGRETISDRAQLDGATNQLHLEGRIQIRGAGGAGAGFAGFDTLTAANIDSDAGTGDFTIPGHFTATRKGAEITGDRAKGNSLTKLITVSGNVVVTIKKPRASTLTCDRLDIDGTRLIYHALGNVHYRETASEVTADRADIIEARTMIHLEGNVHVTEAGRSRGA